MTRLRSFWQHFTSARHYGFPLWWSIRTSWFWSAGPTPAARELMKMREGK